MTPRLVMAALLLLSAAPAAAEPFNRAAWKSDFERLKVALAQGYANIDWQVDKRRFNLPNADRAVQEMLDKADSDVAATLIMVKLLDAFDDPHLQLKAGPPPKSANVLPQLSQSDGITTPQALCTASSYESVRPATRLPYTAAPRWRSLSESPFLAGIIGRVGILRIPEFDESHFLGACRTVVMKGYAGRTLQLAVRAELNRQLQERVSELRAAGMKRLIIDLSRNGGGSEWSTEAAAMFTRGRMDRFEPRRAGPICDRKVIWKGEKAPCSIYAGPPAIEWIDNRDKLIWTGPLAVLVDRHTASAAEEFVTWLQDNGRAKIGGEKTFGAGCGYIDGGNAFAFRAASMHLMMPNCSRIRRDGTNEIEGVTPDVAIDWVKLRPTEVEAAFDKLF